MVGPVAAKPSVASVGSPAQFLEGKMLGKGVKDAIKKLKTGYTPRKLQQILHRSLRRFNVLVCHRRFGKTVCCVNEIIDRALLNPLRNPQYAYVAPFKNQAKKIAWQYFLDFTRFLPGVKANSTELVVTIQRPGRICPLTGELDPDHITIMLVGADDPDSLRGLYLDGAVIDEFAQGDPIVWGQIIRPALGDRKKIARQMGCPLDMGGLKLEPWVIFIGTPKGQNHFYHRYAKAMGNEDYCKEYQREHDVKQELLEWEDLEKEWKINYDDDLPEVELKKILSQWPIGLQEKYKKWRKYLTASNWFTAIYRASETGVLDYDEIEEMRDDLTPEECEQELECSFTAAILGSYYGHLWNETQEDGRIGRVPFNPKYPVDTYWDIGIGDKTTIWFIQKIGKRAVHYIDYYETNGKGVDHFIALFDALAKGNGVRTEIETGEVIGGRAFKYGRHVWPHDGAVREFGSGVSRQETARLKGLNVEIQVRQGVDDRIHAARTRFAIASFDEKYCKRGLECLYNYQKEWDGKLMMFKNKPKHDWSSHGADSYGYSALDDRPSYFPEDRRKQFAKDNFADMDYNELAA